MANREGNGTHSSILAWEIFLGVLISLENVTTLMAESEEKLKSLLMKVKEESEKAGLKLSIQKLR